MNLPQHRGVIEAQVQKLRDGVIGCVVMVDAFQQLLGYVELGIGIKLEAVRMHDG